MAPLGRVELLGEGRDDGLELLDLAFLLEQRGVQRLRRAANDDARRLDAIAVEGHQRPVQGPLLHSSSARASPSTTTVSPSRCAPSVAAWASSSTSSTRARAHPRGRRAPRRIGRVAQSRGGGPSAPDSTTASVTTWSRPRQHVAEVDHLDPAGSPVARASSGDRQASLGRGAGYVVLDADLAAAGRWCAPP